MGLTFNYSLLLHLQIGEAIRKGSENDLFLHYIFMDNAFELPTGLGLQLQVSSSGVITPGIKAGVKLEVANVRLCLPFDSLRLFFSPRMGFLCNLERPASFKTKYIIIEITSFIFMRNFRVPVGRVTSLAQVGQGSNMRTQLCSQ